MNGNTSGSRGLRRAGTLAVVAAVAVLATACGSAVHVGFSGGSASAGPAAFRANLAYAHCMRTHGVPNFPDPSQFIGKLPHQRAPRRKSHRPPGAG